MNDIERDSSSEDRSYYVEDEVLDILKADELVFYTSMRHPRTRTYT